MFHTPAHKQTQDKTLADYYHRKYGNDVAKSFDEWLDSPYVTLNGKTFTRREWWTDTEIVAASEAWAARK